MWHSTIGGVPLPVSDSVTASRTRSYKFVMLDQNVAVSSVSARTPATRRESRRYGPWKRPFAQDAPSSSPRIGPPSPVRISVTAARVDATWSEVSSYPVIMRQPDASEAPTSLGFASPTKVSASSDRRRMVGVGPTWASMRSAVAPSTNEPKRHASYTLVSGTGRTRTVTEVITPKAPSEPMTTSRRSGPAAFAGALPSSRVPMGVDTLTTTKRETKRQYTAEARPNERE